MPTLDRPDAFVPEPHDSEAAELTARVLARSTNHDLHLVVAEDHETLVLPKAVARLLQTILTQIAEGNAVTSCPSKPSSPPSRPPTS